MATTELTRDEIERRAWEIYRQQVRPNVITGHRGHFLALDIMSGDYEVDPKLITQAIARLRERHPNAVCYSFRIGYQTVFSFGSIRFDDL